MDNLKELPQPKKIVVTQVLHRLGFSYAQIGRIVDVPRTTAFSLDKAQVPEGLGQFRTEIEEIFADNEIVLAAKAAARMDETIGRARIDQALAVYQAMRGKNNPQVVVQQNNQFNDIEFFTDENQTTQGAI